MPSILELSLGVVIANDALVVLSTNDAFLRDFECDMRDVVDIDVCELISAKDRRATNTIDRALSQASTTQIDTIAVLEVGEIEHLTRLRMTRDGERWLILVECIDPDDNLIFSLFSQNRRWSAALEGSSDGLVFLDQALRITDYNEQFVQFMSFCSEHGVLLGEEALPGAEFPALLQGEAFASLRTQLDAMWSRDGYRGALELHGRWLDFEVRPLYLSGKGFVGHTVCFRDVSDHHRAEQERSKRQRAQLRHREEVIEAQTRAIRALSAPRIPISSTVTVVPFVGALDRERVSDILEDLLEGVTRDKTRTLILDLTGVSTIDAASAAGLVSVTRALRLVGARAILTGINPQMAQLLASVDIPREELEVRARLEDAIGALIR